MANILAHKNARAFSQNARIRTSSSRPLPVLVALFLFAAGACSDGVVAPEARKGSTPSPDQPLPPAETPPVTPPTNTSGSPFLGAAFFVNPNSSARETAAAWRSTRPADATQMDKIATQSIATWLGGWYPNIASSVNSLTSTMTAAGSLPVFVAYNIPQRDCGGLSGGGGSTADAYRAWIDGVAAGIGARKAVVILEPDALPGMDCLSAADQQTRVELLKYAVAKLRTNPVVAVYLDAGHSNWQSAATMGDRLRRAGVEMANGFSLNISNFYANAPLISYGTSISSLVGGKHFVIDTSRNGLGPTTDYQWCNPPGRAIGTRPTAVTGNQLVDAYIWLKVPGESDGACNGNPNSGVWMPEYALGLAQRG